MSGFIAALGWVLFSMSVGFFVGILVGASANKAKQNQDSDRKMSEK